jgi:hypothetical protein
MKSPVSELRLEPDSRALNGLDPTADVDLPFGATLPPAPGSDRITVGAGVPALDEFAQIRVLTHIAAATDGVVWNGYRYTLDDALTIASQWLRAITLCNQWHRRPRPPSPDPVLDARHKPFPRPPATAAVALPASQGKTSALTALLPEDPDEELFAALACCKAVAERWNDEEPLACS